MGLVAITYSLPSVSHSTLYRSIYVPGGRYACVTPEPALELTNIAKSRTVLVSSNIRAYGVSIIIIKCAICTIFKSQLLFTLIQYANETAKIRQP